MMLWLLLLVAGVADDPAIGKVEARWNPRQALARHKVTGLSIAVIRDSKLAWVKPYGRKSSKRKDAVDVATIFPVGAPLGDLVTSLAALHMAQYGNPGVREALDAGDFAALRQRMQQRFGNKPFDDVLQMIVLGKLGMRDSMYQPQLPRQLHPRAAVASPADFDTPGLWTNPQDLARFVIEIQQAARGESNKVVERTSASEMLQRLQGFASNTGNVLLRADGRNAVIVLSNGSSANAQSLLREIAAAVDAEYNMTR